MKPFKYAINIVVIALVVIVALGIASFAQVQVDFKHYHSTAEINQTLQSLAREYPKLVSVAEIGKSARGKAILAATITNLATGAPEAKPAMYMDGNTHAGEVAGAEAALHMCVTLAMQYGKDPLVTRALDTFTYYVIPRVNPDGADAYLAGGLVDNPRVRDLDGDGIISTMRIRDPNGPLRTDPDDPRLMVPRKGGEPGEWRVLGPEAVAEVPGAARSLVPTVSNRNYSVGWWSADETRHGQGLYPLSEPEAKAQVDFVLGHPNINTLTTYHTHSGLILRSYAHKADDAFIYKDLPYFEGIGKQGAAITGYQFMSSFYGFTPDPTQPRQGTFKDWAYVQAALISWTIEIWKAPGEENGTAFNGTDEHKRMDFIDHKMSSKGFVPWKSFHHPAYGEIEIGGINERWVVQNPPPEFLEAEISKLTRFGIIQGTMSPLVRVTNTSADDLGGGVYKVRASVQNQGYLPTYIPRATLLGIAKGVRVTLEGAEILSEPQAQDVGILQGWGPADESGRGSPVKTVSWVVRGKPGAQITVRATSERAGRDERKITLQGR